MTSWRLAMFFHSTYIPLGGASFVLIPPKFVGPRGWEPAIRSFQLLPAVRVRFRGRLIPPENDVSRLLRPSVKMSIFSHGKNVGKGRLSADFPRWFADYFPRCSFNKHSDICPMNGHSPIADFWLPSGNKHCDVGLPVNNEALFRVWYSLMMIHILFPHDQVSSAEMFHLWPVSYWLLACMP